MEHQMSLYHSGFNCIAAGEQRIEVRINDPKRQQIRLGDTIVFTKKPEADEALDVEVVGLSYFKTLEDLFLSIPPEVFGWPKDITVKEQVDRMHEYYSHAEEKEFGVIAIHIRLIARRVLSA